MDHGTAAVLICERKRARREGRATRPFRYDRGGSASFSFVSYRRGLSQP